MLCQVSLLYSDFVQEVFFFFTEKFSTFFLVLAVRPGGQFYVKEVIIVFLAKKLSCLLINVFLYHQMLFNHTQNQFLDEGCSDKQV
jgi:hypothetical protein